MPAFFFARQVGRPLLTKFLLHSELPSLRVGSIAGSTPVIEACRSPAGQVHGLDVT